MALILLIGCLWSYFGVRTVPKPGYEGMVRAARQMEACMAELKAERLRRGVPVDETTDRFSTGLIGTDFTAITTTLGNLESKRTTCQPDMAALVYDLLVRAGVRAGDRVAICATGSFPALNLATVCAAEALGAEPVVIVSIGASTYGANIPAFTAPEMLYHLYAAGLIAAASAGVTLGGDDDLGLNMGAVFFPEEAEALQQALDRMESAGITVTRIADRGENLAWREDLYGDAACFVSVGGHNMAMGDHGEGYGLGQGLIRKTVTDGEDYLLGHYLSRGVPCVGLLNVKQLCAEYGVPFDPAALENVGQSHIYYTKAYGKGPLIGALLLVGVLLAACRRLEAGKRKDPNGLPWASQSSRKGEKAMDTQIVARFVTAYVIAPTRREKALALYNAVVAAMPKEEVPAFLGEEGEGFLAFIRTMQNEDSDISTAVACEQDAPSEEYLAALLEKLTAR